MDLRPLLPDIHAPALVMVRADDPWVRIENSRYLADHLPAGHLEELPGNDHEPGLGDTDAVFAVLRPAGRAERRIDTEGMIPVERADPGSGSRHRGDFATTGTAGALQRLRCSQDAIGGGPVRSAAVPLVIRFQVTA